MYIHPRGAFDDTICRFRSEFQTSATIGEVAIIGLDLFRKAGHSTD